MSNLNVISIQGNLTADAEAVGKDGNVTRFTIANNTGFGDHKRTNFIDCVAFGKVAELALKFFEKGKQIIVNGQIIQNRWENADGEKRSRLELQLNMVNGFSFVSGGARNEGESDSAPAEVTAGADASAGTASDSDGGNLF